MKRLTWLSLLCLCLLVACSDSSTSAEVASTDLADYLVVDNQGEVIGRVKNTLVNRDSGQMSYAIVELISVPTPFGGLAPEGYAGDGKATRLAIPWRFLSFDAQARQLSLEVADSVLYDAPRLAQEIDELEAGWDEPVKAYWEAESSVTDEATHSTGR
jgi:sporulation protein YlmC with PRC-barrel domain